jgi:hypothetical protein
MRPRTVFCVGAAALLAACERVTAPKALQIADDTEQKLMRDWNPAVIRQLYDAESMLNPFWPDSGRSMIALTKDGETEQLNAAVIERVYVPPDGEGAPASRRSFVAWLPNASYGILAATESGAEESGALANYSSANDPLHPGATLVAPHANEQDWWLGRAGTVAIEPKETGSACPFGNGGGDAEEDVSHLVTCDVAMYTVRLDGDLVRRLDAENHLMPETMKRHHRIIVAPQRVKGIRFTIRCATSLNWRSSFQGGCFANNSALMFWRTDTLFARSLNVDVAEMKPLPEGQTAGYVYGRTLRPGSEKRPEGPRVVRWTVSYPNGALVERDSLLDYADFPPRDVPWLQQCTAGMGYGGRRQCLVQPWGHPKSRSPFAVFVVDVEDAGR